MLILLFTNVLTIKNTFLKVKKDDEQESNELKKCKMEIDLQYKVLEKMASLYENTLKCSNEKAEFFYNMSHELKTPLTVILGAIQLIEQKNSYFEVDRRKSSKHITTIKQNCYRLLRLIRASLTASPFYFSSSTKLKFPMK